MQISCTWIDQKRELEFSSHHTVIQKNHMRFTNELKTNVKFELLQTEILELEFSKKRINSKNL